MSGRNYFAAVIAVILMIGGGGGFLVALANIQPGWNSDRVDPDFLLLSIWALVVVVAGVWLARIAGGRRPEPGAAELAGALKDVATDRADMSGEWYWFAVIFGVLLLLFGGGCVLANISVAGTFGGVLLLFGIPGWIALVLGWWLLRRRSAKFFTSSEINPDGTRRRKFDPPPE